MTLFKQRNKLLSSFCLCYSGVGETRVQRVRFPEDQLSGAAEEREAAGRRPVEEWEAELQGERRDDRQRSSLPNAGAQWQLAAVLPGGQHPFRGHWALGGTHLHPHCHPEWRGGAGGGGGVRELAQHPQRLPRRRELWRVCRRQPRTGCLPFWGATGGRLSQTQWDVTSPRKPTISSWLIGGSSKFPPTRPVYRTGEGVAGLVCL